MGSRGELGLAEEMLVGTFVARANCVRLPARPWPLAAACESLLTNSADLDPLLLDVVRAGAAGGGEAACERWLAQLASAGAVRPSGCGVNAAWMVVPAWRDQWCTVSESLSGAESAAFNSAAQALSRCLSIWEKTVAAATSTVAPSAS